jgi:PAS domain S-box-containing protein
VILESIGSGLVAFDETGRVNMFNRAAERILGIPARNALGRSVSEIFPADEPFRGLAREILEDLRSPSRVEFERPGADGESAWLGVSGSVIRDPRGVPQGGLLLVDDVTETNNLRDAAGLKDRLSAVGEMSAGIAHEIKNSLHALMGHANLLKEDHSGDEPPLPVRGILTEVRALETMVKGILEFSKPTRLVRTAENVNEMLKDTAESVRDRAIAAGVEIRYEFNLDLPRTRIDANSVRRVFLNCVLNANEAMGHGGTLTISTRPAAIPGIDATESHRPRAIRIAFRDTGPGIPEADRQRIFTPFYSTKRDGHGLGLALVHRTVTDHGGRLHLHSREEVGTEFVIVLPVEDGE